MQASIKPNWDVIIVGCGPAGSAAAMVLARSRRDVLVIDDGNPRNLKSHGIHNYLTRDRILPGEFSKITRGELDLYGVTFIKGRAVAAASADNRFTVTDDQQHTYSARKLLIATGVTDIIPDIPGMLDLWGNGVYHCPYCDGWDLKGQTVGLYAKRYNGYGMSLALRQLTDKVILFTDTARYLTAAQRNHLEMKDIEVVSSRIARLTCAEGKLTCVTLSNGKSIGCNSLFTHNGIRYNNDLILQLGGKCNSKGAVLINKRQECNVAGLYVAGDTAFDMQFVTVAAAEGVKAAVAINNSLLKEDNATYAADISLAKR